MKSCKGCRYILADRINDVTVQVCTGAPPSNVVVGDRLSSYYPLLPNARCGMFRRRPFWLLRWLCWR